MGRASGMPLKKPSVLYKCKEQAHLHQSPPKDGKGIQGKCSKHAPVREVVHIIENKQWVPRDCSSLANSSCKKGSVPAPAHRHGACADCPAACLLPGTLFEPEHPLKLPLRLKLLLRLAICRAPSMRPISFRCLVPIE